MSNSLDKLRNESLRGEILVRDYDGEQGRVVCLYGDPEGLKSLAKKLFILANLQQWDLPPQSLPDGEGFHVHLTEGLGLDSISHRLDLGRLDAKADGDTDWYKRAFDI